MRIDLITLFPEPCSYYLSSSIIGRAIKNGIINMHFQNPRIWAKGRHHEADSRPFGGGPGMVLKAPPIASCIDYLRTKSSTSRLLMTSPQGEKLTQQKLKDLSKEEHLIILSGHYEGIDERIVEKYNPEEFSIGDFVLSGGELPGMVLIDGVTRLLPGALGDNQSAIEDSFTENLLDHPCYTKPRNFQGLEVPEILLSGDHKKIEEWRLEQRIRRTKERRPDLLDQGDIE